MASKKDIIKNLREYSSDQLAEAIRNGVVSMYELSKSGNLTPLMRKRIESKLTETPVTEQNIQIQNNIESIPQNTGNSDEENEYNNNLIEPPVVPIQKVDIPDAKIDELVMPVSDITNEQYTVGTTLGFSENVLDNRGMFKRPFSFRGRIRRLEYGFSMIAIFIYSIIINSITLTIFQLNANPNIAIIFLIIIMYIPFYWLLWAQNCKRCHDLGNSGWWQLIPFYGFWLLFASGNDGENKYGNNPKK